ncbi:MAG: zinc-dependent peptidase [Deltaproteobacteria bacterium]|nr:zinc-dependent peptidase [Deltaproteobacteria bacterium]
MFGWLSKRRRDRILAEPMPPSWDAIIDRNVALARRLTRSERTRLGQLVQVFVAEKHWEGCGGLELTEEMQVTIAAQACILVLGRDDSLYSDVASILVYPSTMITPPRRLGTFEQPRAPIAEGHAILGEAMLGGPVILAWDTVLAGGREEISGNVVFHELAHKIDMANGAIDGTPPLTRRERLRWQKVMSAAYDELHARLRLGVHSVIDPYGATNEAEFFAVATETFFTRPDELAFENPALYALLSDFYQLVPVGRAPSWDELMLFS